MEHNHHHHHHLGESITGDLKKVYICAIILTALFIAFEAWMGLRSDAMSLVSDAGHKLVDLLSMGLTLLAFYLSSSKPAGKLTFGYRKLTVIISLFNALVVIAVAGTIIVESIEKMSDVSALSPDPGAISLTAAVGIVVNFLVVTLLSYQRRHDVNTRGAFLHALTDCLLSFGVVIGGFVIKWTGFVMLDPIISLCIAGFIIANMFSVLVESFRLSIDAVPENVNMAKLEEDIMAYPGVKDLDRLHVWPVSTTETSLTAGVTVAPGSDRDELVSGLKDVLKADGITESTLETRVLSGTE